MAFNLPLQIGNLLRTDQRTIEHSSHWTPLAFPTLCETTLARPGQPTSSVTRRQQDTRPTPIALQVSVLPHASPTEEVRPWLCQHILYRCEEGRHSHRSVFQTQVFTSSNESKVNSPGRPQAGPKSTRQGTRDPGRVLVGGREGKFPAVLVGYTKFPRDCWICLFLVAAVAPRPTSRRLSRPRCWCYGCFSPLHTPNLRHAHHHLMRG